MAAKTDRALSVTEAAEFLGVSVESVRRAVRRGALPATKDQLARGAPLYFLTSDLRAYSERRHEPVVPREPKPRVKPVYTPTRMDAEGNLIIQ